MSFNSPKKYTVITYTKNSVFIYAKKFTLYIGQKLSHYLHTKKNVFNCKKKFVSCYTLKNLVFIYTKNSQQKNLLIVLKARILKSNYKIHSKKTFCSIAFFCFVNFFHQLMFCSTPLKKLFASWKATSFLGVAVGT